jgi:alkyl sulfatase BDS1-like metallo-beta-lactamase superfamily hydrolase
MTMPPEDMTPKDMTPKDAHPATLQAHAANVAGLDFSDTGDFDDAGRGYIATIPDAQFSAKAGGLAWTMRDHEFLDGPLSNTVNPSLWRMARLNRIHGLFQVTERIFQVRGFCLANITGFDRDRSTDLRRTCSSRA